MPICFKMIFSPTWSHWTSHRQSCQQLHHVMCCNNSCEGASHTKFIFKILKDEASHFLQLHWNHQRDKKDQSPICWKHNVSARSVCIVMLFFASCSAPIVFSNEKKLAHNWIFRNSKGHLFQKVWLHFSSCEVCRKNG